MCRWVGGGRCLAWGMPAVDAESSVPRGHQNFLSSHKILLFDCTRMATEITFANLNANKGKMLIATFVSCPITYPISMIAHNPSWELKFTLYVVFFFHLILLNSVAYFHRCDDGSVQICQP